MDEGRVVNSEVQGIHLFAIILIWMGKGINAGGVIHGVVPGVAVISNHDSVGICREVDGEVQSDGGVATVDCIEVLSVVTGLIVGGVVPCIRETGYGIY